MKPALVLFVLFVLSSHLNAQEVSDSVKRSFSELNPIRIDLDGDRKPDVIQPRTYALIADCPTSKKINFNEIKYWIEFDLTLSSGRRLPAFFKYEYGTAEVSYWVYALISAGDIDNDGKTDLIFYSGDDTSDETVVLLNRSSRFIVKSRKLGGPDP